MHILKIARAHSKTIEHLLALMASIITEPCSKYYGELVIGLGV